MRIKINQIIRQFFLLVNRLTTVEKIICSILTIVLARSAFFAIADILKYVANYVVKNYLTIFAIVIGILLFGVGCYLYFLKAKRNQSNSDVSSTDTSSIEENTTTESLTIYTEGNYNESIHGDYIEIQGNYININQDFSEVAAEIRELITQLKNEGYSQENAEAQIAIELAEEAHKKPKVKKKLLKWRKSFASTTTKTNNEAEVAREVVKTATAYSYTSSKDFTEVVGGYYQQLNELLQAKKWEEADLETAKIIYTVSQKELPKSSLYRTYLRNYFGSEHIKVLPRKDLNTIDKLWVKHSNGRFGFSVQKQIWKKLGGGCDTDYTDYKIAEKFGNVVGWRKERNWLYYVDLYDSLRTAPPGHLPLALMLNSGKTERCDEIDFSILEVIVGRL